MYYIYILRCRDGSFYTGSTNDVEKRFKDHLEGHGARYTKSHKPEKIIYREKFTTKSEALKREAEIKKMPRKKKEFLINSWYNRVINNSLPLNKLVEILLEKGGHINKYYLKELNKNRHAIVFLNGWFSGKNIREALLRALGWNRLLLLYHQ